MFSWTKVEKWALSGWMHDVPHHSCTRVVPILRTPMACGTEGDVRKGREDSERNAIRPFFLLIASD